jgi:hypothetical protein
MISDEVLTCVMASAGLSSHSFRLYWSGQSTVREGHDTYHRVRCDTLRPEGAVGIILRTRTPSRLRAASPHQTIGILNR